MRGVPSVDPGHDRADAQIGTRAGIARAAEDAQAGGRPGDTVFLVVARPVHIAKIERAVGPRGDGRGPDVRVVPEPDEGVIERLGSLVEDAEVQKHHVPKHWRAIERIRRELDLEPDRCPRGVAVELRRGDAGIGERRPQGLVADQPRSRPRRIHRCSERHATGHPLARARRVPACGGIDRVSKRIQAGAAGDRRPGHELGAVLADRRAQRALRATGEPQPASERHVLPGAPWKLDAESTTAADDEEAVRCERPTVRELHREPVHRDGALLHAGRHRGGGPGARSDAHEERNERSDRRARLLPATSAGGQWTSDGWCHVRGSCSGPVATLHPARLRARFREPCAWQSGHPLAQVAAADNRPLYMLSLCENPTRNANWFTSLTIPYHASARKSFLAFKGVVMPPPRSSPSLVSSPDLYLAH